MNTMMRSAAMVLAVGATSAAAQVTGSGIVIRDMVGGVHVSATPGLAALSADVQRLAMSAEVLAAKASMSSLSSMASLASLSSLSSLASLSSAGATLGSELGYMQVGLSHVAGVGFFGVERAIREMPPEPWAQGDAADSIYRLARTAMSRNNYNRAAELFERIGERYPNSKYAPDAMYYQAFSLFRNGGSEDLNKGLEVLAQLEKKHPSAEAIGDARSLRTRIKGELAKRGDANRARDITIEATNVGDSKGRPRSSGSGSCDESDDSDAVMALQALMNMDSERAVPILSKVMKRRDECAYVLRRKAVWLLSQKRSDEVVDILLAAAKDDPDREVREQAIFWMSQVRSDRVLPLLQEILKASRDDQIKDKAIFAISNIKTEPAAKILRDIAMDENESTEIRDKAIFWLGQQRSQENADFLRSIYSKVNNQELKDKVLFSLSQMRGFGNDQWLLDIATNEKEDIELRKKALFHAGQARASIEQLVGLWAKMTDFEMRDQLIFTYSNRREPAAVDKLFDIAKNEKDKELRKKAIFWLGQSRDPRVPQFLADLIDK